MEAIDYATRDERFWLRRHRRTVAVVLVAATLAFLVRPAFVQARRWLDWQLAWRDLAAEAARQVDDRPLDEQVAAAPPPSDRPWKLTTQPADAARRMNDIVRLVSLDRGLPRDFLYASFPPADVRVYRMTRPDGVRRLVLIQPPGFTSRPFNGISVAICREPTWFDASFDRTLNVMPTGVSAEGFGEINVLRELRLSDDVPQRLILRVDHRSGQSDPQRMGFEGRLTNDDQLRWRMIESLQGDEMFRVRIGPAMTFEDAEGNIVEPTDGGVPVVTSERMLRVSDTK